MGLKTHKFRTDVVTIHPHLEGEKIEIRYFPGRQTVAEMKAMGRLLGSANLEDQIAVMAKWVAENVEYVDWQDEDGEQVQLTEESLASQPFAALEFIFKSVMEHKNAGGKK